MDIDHAEYELVFDPEGSVTLLDSEHELVWASDSDDDFADDFEGDLFTGDDAEEILEYLEEHGILPEGSEVDIVEFDPDDDDDEEEEAEEEQPKPKQRRRGRA